MSNVLPFPSKLPPITLPAGPFSIIYLDPPWRFETRSDKGKGKSPDRHYATMNKQQLMLMAPQIGAIAADDCHMIGWVYDPLYDFCMDFYKACGFQFTTPLFRWLKTTNKGSLCLGTGYHSQGGGCEEAWLFKRGKGLKRQQTGIRKEFYSKRREHSRKPDEVADNIVRLYGDRPRIELFARGPRAGWTVWGNEIDKFSPPTTPAAAIAA